MSSGESTVCYDNYQKHRPSAGPSSPGPCCAVSGYANSTVSIIAMSGSLFAKLCPVRALLTGHRARPLPIFIALSLQLADHLKVFHELKGSVYPGAWVKYTSTSSLVIPPGLPQSPGAGLERPPSGFRHPSVEN